VTATSADGAERPRALACTTGIQLELEKEAASAASSFFAIAVSRALLDAGGCTARAVFGRHRGFACGGDVFAARALQNVLGAGNFVRR
jgi:hypothetical protein